MVSWSLTTLSNFCLGWVASPTRNLSSWPGTYTSSGLKKVAESGMAAAGRRSGPPSTRLRVTLVTVCSCCEAHLSRPATSVCPNLNAAVAKLLIIEGFTESSYLETVAWTVTIKQINKL